MSTAARFSPATVWVCAAAMLILFYFASTPVIYFVSHRSALWFPSGVAGASIRVAEAYIGLYYWMEKHTPLRSLLKPYSDWWAKRIFGREVYRYPLL